MKVLMKKHKIIIINRKRKYKQYYDEIKILGRMDRYQKDADENLKWTSLIKLCADQFNLARERNMFFDRSCSIF